MRILIVEDEPELVEQIRQALAKQKYTVDTAFDGEEALDRIYVDPYDLILLDIMLPKKDGLPKAVLMTEYGGLILGQMIIWPNLFPWRSCWPVSGHYSGAAMRLYRLF